MADAARKIDPEPTLYQADFYAWLVEQSRLLAMRDFAALDLGNLIEEIDSLGRSQVREIDSHLTRIVRHLLKLEFSPADQPRRKWHESVSESRTEIELLLAGSPSLDRTVDIAIPAALNRGAKLAGTDLDDFGELDTGRSRSIASRRYSRNELLGRWWPAR